MSETNKSSPWVWLSLIIIVGLFSAFILFLDHKIVKSGRGPIDEKPQQGISSEPVIDFYSVLPDREIEVQVPESTVEEESTNSVTSSTQKKRFMIQAGSFRKAQDADRRKAELAMLGLEAEVKRAHVDGVAYHRVELGPFSDDGFFSKVRSRLIANDIQFIPKSVN